MARVLANQLGASLTERGIDITVEQWRLLYYLWQKDGINQQQLAKIAKKEKSTITRQIDGLVAKGLLNRVSGTSDKRNRLLFLSELGKKIEKEALSPADTITAKAEEGIGPERMKIFKEVLEEMILNIKDL